MDLSALSKFDGRTLWAWYRREANDWHEQLAAAKRKHGFTDSDGVTCIVRPWSSAKTATVLLANDYKQLYGVWQVSKRIHIHTSRGLPFI